VHSLPCSRKRFIPLNFIYEIGITVEEITELRRTRLSGTAEHSSTRISRDHAATLATDAAAIAILLVIMAATHERQIGNNDGKR